MSKLKDFKKFIQGWPEKKDLSKCDCKYNNACEECLRAMSFNQAHEIFSNLPFNPAEMIDLDEQKIMDIIHQSELCQSANKNADWPVRRERKSRLAQAIVKAFKAGGISREVLK